MENICFATTFYYLLAQRSFLVSTFISEANAQGHLTINLSLQADFQGSRLLAAGSQGTAF
jgi:uncharacterized membrane protein YciS (DUF1049 family)